MKFFSYLFILVLFTTSSYAKENEETLKGVILSRISQLITYKQGREEFNVCIYKDKSMYNSLARLYKNKKYKKLPIKVLPIDMQEHFFNCDIFYASKVDKNLLQKFNHEHLQHTLLVCDSISKLDNGFIMALYLKEKKIKIAINQEALLKTQLNINYRLLGAASTIINQLKYSDAVK